MSEKLADPADSAKQALITSAMFNIHMYMMVTTLDLTNPDNFLASLRRLTDNVLSALATQAELELDLGANHPHPNISVSAYVFGYILGIGLEQLFLIDLGIGKLAKGIKLTWQVAVRGPLTYLRTALATSRFRVKALRVLGPRARSKAELREIYKGIDELTSRPVCVLDFN